MHSRKKRILSLLLACGVCAYLLALPNSIPVHAHEEETEVASVESADPTSPLDSANESQENPHPSVFAKDLADYGWISSSNEDQLKALHEAPPEVLEASTMELLEYFLGCSLMAKIHLAWSCRSSTIGSETDSDVAFYYNEAFVELLSRKDLVDTLEAYALNHIDSLSDQSDFGDIYRFKRLLKHEAIAASIPVHSFLGEYVPIYTRGATPIQPTQTIFGIKYYADGYVYTMIGNKVLVEEPEREMTQAEINETIANVARQYGHTLVNQPTTQYNCHSYAWYESTSSNPHWISDITPYLNDPHCTLVSMDSIQENDIIVYYDLAGQPSHSGIVYSVQNAGTDEMELMVVSKWGRSGVYIHEYDEVPYTLTPNTDLICVNVYRYCHNYPSSSSYLSSHYHKGAFHYYRYEYHCSICNDIIYTTEFLPCNGPPCILPGVTSIDDEDESLN